MQLGVSAFGISGQHHFVKRNAARRRVVAIFVFVGVAAIVVTLLLGFALGGIRKRKSVYIQFLHSDG